MRIAIDITEATNGYRFDVIEDGKKSRLENCETADQAILYLKLYADGLIKSRKPPTHTMEVL